MRTHSWLSLAFLAAASSVSAQLQGIAGPLLNLVRTISPAPVLQTEDWNGTEYRYNRIVFRPAQFKVEGVLISCILGYFVLFYIGKSQNYRRAHAWFDAHIPLFENQFSAPTPRNTDNIVQDGACDFFNFSTGRRAIASLHTTAALLPRHDAILTVYNFLWTLYDLTYTPRDEIQLDFTLHPSNPTPPFVWGIIKKDEMSEMRRTRWDLTFTKGSEFPLLPPDLCVFSEAADITESILKFSPSLPLAKVLHDPGVLKYFRSLIITDQPTERPYEPVPAADRSRHVILTLNSPPPSEAAATLPIVTTMFTLADLLDTKLPLRPETKTKLKARRDEVDEDLRKEASKERNEEQEESKRAAKKKAEEEKVSKLSASEQKKFEEKERKKALRKQQGKMVSRK